MNPDYLQILLVAAYLLGGTISIVLVMGWALKRRKSQKTDVALTGVPRPKKPFGPQTYDSSNHTTFKK